MVLHKAYALNRHDMLYVVFLMAGVLAAFKPYPTLSDPGLFLSMISLFPETYPRKSNRSLFVGRSIQSEYRLASPTCDSPFTPPFRPPSPTLSSSVAFAGYR